MSSALLSKWLVPVSSFAVITSNSTVAQSPVNHRSDESHNQIANPRLLISSSPSPFLGKSSSNHHSHRKRHFSSVEQVHLTSSSSSSPSASSSSLDCGSVELSVADFRSRSSSDQPLVDRIQSGSSPIGHLTHTKFQHLSPLSAASNAGRSHRFCSFTRSSPFHHSSDHDNHANDSSTVNGAVATSFPTSNQRSNLFQGCLAIDSPPTIFELSQHLSESPTSGQLIPKNPKTAAFIVASSIYGQLLVVVCLAFFTAEICTSLPLLYFEGFYLYLYSVSLLFLLYVYIYLLRGLSSSEIHRIKHGKVKKEKISETERSHGSIFLRIGAVGFGLGSMVYNGLEFGSFFEIPLHSPCYSILLGINPVLQATFTFAQMYFIFTYSRLMINKFKLIARLGLMHLVGTNICIWIRTLGKETLQELKASTSYSFLEELILPLRIQNKRRFDLSTHSNQSHSSAFMMSLPENVSVNRSNPCGKEDIMGTILNDTSPYLYPFIVEYSLIGAAFLYVMWCNIGRLAAMSTINQHGVVHRSVNTFNELNSGSTSPTLSTGVGPAATGIQPEHANTQPTTNVSLCTQSTTAPSAGPNAITHKPVITQSPTSLDNISTDSSGDSLQRKLNPYGASHVFNASSVYAHHHSHHNPYSASTHSSPHFASAGHLTSTQSLYSCLGSSKGLFCGFLFLVISITSLIIFFVLVHHRNYHYMATMISDLSHSVLLVLSSVSILIAFFKIRKLKFQPGVHDTADGGLRDLLLRVAAFGLYVYSLFGVIAGALKPHSLQNLAVLITSALTIIQVTLQSLFISDVVCRKRNTLKQPGRQLITFLLIANLTLWIIYTFEMQKVEASPVQLKVYGFTTWALIVRITLPLSIFYRFHSAITFAEVWKNSYK